MRVAVRFDVTDEQRNALACLLAGKKVARLATRDDFTAFVMGAVEAIGEAPVSPPVAPAAGIAPDIAAPPVAPLRGLTEAEERHAQKLRAEGKPEGYIRGWITASRQMFGGRLGAG